MKVTFMDGPWDGADLKTAKPLPMIQDMPVDPRDGSPGSKKTRYILRYYDETTAIYQWEPLEVA